MKIGFWNINGLGNKLEDENFISILKKYEIICLTETWGLESNIDNLIIPDGYQAFHHYRKNKHKKAKRNSGGIMVLYKKEIGNFLKLKNKENENILWIQIDKKLLLTKKNLVLGTVYISPINSTINNRTDNSFDSNETFATLYQHISSFSNENDILIGGDFNARTGDLIDFIETENNEEVFLPLPEIFENNTFSKSRINQDKKYNNFGLELKDICISANMYILNGRTLGDFTGEYTYIGYRGCSVVDYVLASENLVNHMGLITKFKVEDLTTLSDHKILSVNLNNFIPYRETEKPSCNEEYLKRKKYFNDMGEFKKITKGIPFKKAITELNNKMTNGKQGIESIDESVNKFSFILDTALQGSTNNMISTQSRYKKSVKKKIGKNSWYNNDCRILKRNLNYLCKAVSRDPNNFLLRNNYYKTRKKYRNLTKYYKKKFETDLINELENKSLNSKEFWSSFKNLKKGQIESLPEPADIQNYFSELYATTSNSKSNIEGHIFDDDKLNSNLNKFEITERINVSEIKDQLSNLKLKKSAGIDGITNEILRDSSQEMLIFYELLFNKILEYWKYPNSWNISLTRLFYKDGQRDMPENYRGIALISNLAKLFNGIMNNRIRDYLVKNNLIAFEQGGFRKGFRTTDHIFVLQTIIKKYISKGKKVYSCFIDLKKAFDSIDKNLLKKKLDNIGFGRNTINLLMNMYENTFTSIIYKNNLLPKIQTHRGLKQGDILSPLLFIIFINDLPEILKKVESDPIELQGSHINCLLWADDIILFSESETGLQNCLNNLNLYCKDWDLMVNFKKTKSMIFNKAGRNISYPKFKLNSRVIENVNSYSYLGFSISASGKFTKGIERLIDKAQRAWFSILKFINKSTHKNVDTYINLFDNTVKPILLYACEIWGHSDNKHDISNLGKSAIEKFHLKVCKHIIGVHRKASNVATLTELGRYPLQFDIQNRLIKYLLRFNMIEKNRLVYKAYLEETQNITTANSWLGYSKKILDNSGLSYIFINHMSSNYTEQHYINKMVEILKKRNKDTFEQTIMHLLHTSCVTNKGKLVFYGKIKCKFQKEEYLNLKNFKNRKTITNIRMSAHKLKIETGRYEKIDRKERICTYCNLGAIEDEEHFLLKCPAYSTFRDKLSHEIFHESGIDLNHTGLDGLKSIFSKNNIKILNSLAIFIRQCWVKRNT